MGFFDRLRHSDGLSHLSPEERAAVEADGGELVEMVRHHGQNALKDTVEPPFEVGLNSAPEEQS